MSSGSIVQKFVSMDHFIWRLKKIFFRGLIKYLAHNHPQITKTFFETPHETVQCAMKYSYCDVAVIRKHPLCAASPPGSLAELCAFGIDSHDFHLYCYWVRIPPKKILKKLFSMYLTVPFQAYKRIHTVRSIENSRKGISIDHPTQIFHSLPPGGTNTDK